MDNDWNEQLLGRLRKLENTEQYSIGAVSSWCTFYRNKAKVIVETWCREFENADKDRKISLVYLAHEIILNSKKTKDCDGFLEDFWRVLPIYLQDVYQNGQQIGKKVASKLVDIWEKHKVFKPSHHNLRAYFLGESRPSGSRPSSLDDGFSPVLPRKRKLEVTFQAEGTAEKIVAAYQAADKDYIDEAAIWKAYKSSSKRVKEIDYKVHNGCPTGSVDFTQSTKLYDELIHEETILLECTTKMESNEKTIAALISQLKEVIKKEEYNLDRTRDTLKDFKDQAGNARRIRKNFQTSTAVNIKSTKMATKGSSSHVSRP